MIYDKGMMMALPRLMKFVLCGLVVVALLPTFVQAQIATTIDFESVPGVTPTPSFLQHSEAPLSSYISDQFLETHGVSFYSPAPNPAAIAYIRLGQGHATSGSYGVGSIDVESRIDYSLPLMASFFVPGATGIPAVTDIVSIQGDQASCCEDLTIEAYDVDGDFLATATTVAVPGGTYLEISHPGIHSVRVLEESGSVAWDDFAFGELTPVPEPSTWILGAVGCTGAVLLRRRRR